VRTTQALLEAILDRRLPLDRLPNEPDLANQMGVSRTTIRAALQSLDRLGMSSRAPGRGTRLAPTADENRCCCTGVIGLRSMLEDQYGAVDVEQSFTMSPELSTLAAEALGLPPETETLVNHKVYSVQGTRVVRLLQEVPPGFPATGHGRDPHIGTGLGAAVDLRAEPILALSARSTTASSNWCRASARLTDATNWPVA
jgi:DNA-binding GntR family transcriptional regulator